MGQILFTHRSCENLKKWQLFPPIQGLLEASTGSHNTIYSFLFHPALVGQGHQMKRLGIIRIIGQVHEKIINKHTIQVLYYMKVKQRISHIVTCSILSFCQLMLMLLPKGAADLLL